MKWTPLRNRTKCNGVQINGVQILNVGIKNKNCRLVKKRSIGELDALVYAPKSTRGGEQQCFFKTMKKINQVPVLFAKLAGLKHSTYRVLCKLNPKSLQKERRRRCLFDKFMCYCHVGAKGWFGELLKKENDGNMSMFLRWFVCSFNCNITCSFDCL